ncbi:MAG: hypothetical protein WC799_00035 [Desulfobacteraceae bacterium]
MIIRALWGAIGVNAIALLYIPGHAASFRLLKWGIWGIVLATLAVIYSISGAGRSFRLVPGDRRIFMVAGGLVMWSVLAPFISTPFVTAHTAGILQLCMGFSFSWLVALELSDADQKTRCGSLFVLGVGGAILSIIVLLQAAGLTLPGLYRRNPSNSRHREPWATRTGPLLFCCLWYRSFLVFGTNFRREMVSVL